MNNRTPYTQSFSFNLQRALPGNFVFEVGYVGTKGTRLARRSGWRSSAAGRSRHANSNGGFMPPRFPMSPESRITSMRFPPPTIRLQVKVEKRFSHGLQFLSTYTFSKSIDNESGSPVTGGGDSNSSNFVQDPFDWNADRALSSFNVGNKFVTAFNYNLPFGRGQAIGAEWNRAVRFDSWADGR